MKINGKKYLDANDYRRIAIVGVKDIKCNVIGEQVKYPTVKQQYPISSDIDKNDDVKAVEQILNYYLRYNKLHEVKEGNCAGYKLPGIVIQGNISDFFLSVPNKQDYRKLGRMVLQKYKADRQEIINEFDSNITVEFKNKRMCHYINYDDQGKVTGLNLTLENNERDFCINLLRGKLSNTNEIVYARSGPSTYVGTIQVFLNGLAVEGETFRFKVYTMYNDLIEQLNQVCEEHNLEIEKQSKLQLKMKGFK